MLKMFNYNKKDTNFNALVDEAVVANGAGHGEGAVLQQLVGDMLGRDEEQLTHMTIMPQLEEMGL